LFDEFEMNLRLLGANTIKDVVPSMVDARSISLHTSIVPEDRTSRGNYEGLSGPQFPTAKDPASKL